MTRLAVLSDIHGNLPALDAVIQDIQSSSVDEVIVAGDLVGRGPQGSAVVDRIRSLQWPCIRGNHEDYLLAFCSQKVAPEWLITDEWAASRWMANELHSEARAFIQTLPFSTHSQTAPHVRVVHGSPFSHSEGIGPWTDPDRLDEHLDAVDEDLLICAHTHRPLHRERPSGSIVNVGSVGLPFNGDTRAQYAIFDLDPTTHTWTHTFRQVPYDLDTLKDIYHSSGFYTEGKITARLLFTELETARPHLVPFLTWARLKQLPPHPEHLDAFYNVYDPDAPISAFFEVLKRLGLKSPRRPHPTATPSS